MDFNSLKDIIKGQVPGTTNSVNALNKIHMTPAAKKAAALVNASNQAKALGRGQGLAAVLGIAEEVIRNTDTDYGRSVKKARDVQDFNLDNFMQDPLGYAFGSKKLPDYAAATQLDPKKTDGGLNTSTGKVEAKPRKEVKTYDSFQEQQSALMGSLGITANPFSSTRLATTSDSIYNNFPTGDDVPDFGIDTSKMLTNVDTAKLSELYNNPDRETTFRISDDPFLQDYVPPVNYNAGQGSVDPKFYPEQQSSMKAMRMKDRDLGLMYASGQFFAENKDGKSVLVNRDLAKDVRRGKEGAADQLAAYLAGGGIRPEGGVIANPDRGLMVPPKTEESQITPTPGIPPSYSSISTADFTNTGAFNPDLRSSLLEEGYELPSFTKKAGFNNGSLANTGMFAIDPEVYKVMQDSKTPYFFKD